VLRGLLNWPKNMDDIRNKYMKSMLDIRCQCSLSAQKTNELFSPLFFETWSSEQLAWITWGSPKGLIAAKLFYPYQFLLFFFGMIGALRRFLR